MSQYQQFPKPSREEAIKRNASNFIIAAIRGTGYLDLNMIESAIAIAAKLYDSKVPDAS